VGWDVTTDERRRFRRRSIRLPGYDYTSPGAYFVTICTYLGACILESSEFQAVVGESWEEIPLHFPHAQLDEFVVMPNHVHGIVCILDTGSAVGAQHAAPLRGDIPTVRPGSLGATVRSFKSAVAKRINQIRGTPGAPVWQRNYYERVVRDEDELARIREYVHFNPVQWQLDRENPRRLVDREYRRRWDWLEGG
jgi:putative transposase